MRKMESAQNVYGQFVILYHVSTRPYSLYSHCGMEHGSTHPHAVVSNIGDRDGNGRLRRALAAPFRLLRLRRVLLDGDMRGAARV